MQQAGLVSVRTFSTRIFPDIPAATPIAGAGKIVTGEEGLKGRREWSADDGGRVFDTMVEGKGMEKWKEDGAGKKKERWVEEWVKLGIRDDEGNLVVREEGRLIVGIGFRD